MPQITARIPEELGREIDAAAAHLKRSRAQVVRLALEYYLEDFEDLRVGLERLQDPSDPILDWEDVRSGLLGQD
ncbi:MAG: ribbon-helix-helix protein, CopG family [Thermoanaerobaculia bacterium]